MFHSKQCFHFAILIIIMASQKTSLLGKDNELIRFLPPRPYSLAYISLAKFGPFLFYAETYCSNVVENVIFARISSKNTLYFGILLRKLIAIGNY